MTKRQPIQLVDYAGISAVTGVDVRTLRVWAGRGHLPDPDVRLGQSPGWYPATIQRWAAARGLAKPTPINED